ncbi:hypothetical protein TETLIM3_000047 [Candidatus Hodgkinia cicadicola]|nr:hypothetical protein TETLIM3_000047 [Candidatus Hodgkinia cicadicola]
MLGLFAFNRLNFETRVSAMFLRGTYHRFIARRVCKLILLKDGLFWLFNSARSCVAKRAQSRFNNYRNKLLVCCTRDFAKTLVFCALLLLDINCTAQYYSCGNCSDNFSVSRFETDLCLNPLVRIQVNDVVNLFWLCAVLRFVALSKQLRLTSYSYLFGRVPKRCPTPFVFSRLERAFAVLLA